MSVSQREQPVVIYFLLPPFIPFCVLYLASSFNHCLLYFLFIFPPPFLVKHFAALFLEDAFKKINYNYFMDWRSVVFVFSFFNLSHSQCGESC